MRACRAAVVGMIAGGVFACSEEPGRVEVRFEWDVPVAERPTAEDGLVVSATVRFPPNDERTAPEAEPYAPGMRLSVPAVPHGPERTLFIEFRDGASSILRYLGESEPFALRRNRTVQVPVRVRLVAAPQLRGDSTADGVEVLSASHGGFVTDPVVRLRLSGRGIGRIRVAQNVALTSGLATVTATTGSVELRTDADGFQVFEFDYDLNAGFDCGGGRCQGQRSLFFRLESGDGYVFAPARPVLVTLDTVPPTIVAASVAIVPPALDPLPEPREARVDSAVRVRVTMTEPVVIDPPPQLQGDFGGVVWSFELRSRSEASAAQLDFEAIVRAESVPGGYALRLDAVDVAGNASSTTLDGVGATVRTATPVLQVDQEDVSLVISPIGRRLVGPTFELARGDPWAQSGSLPAEVFRLEDGAELTRLRVWADAARTSTLSVIEPDADGSWPRTRFAQPPAAEVYVTGVDAAGNESSPVRIDKVWFVATTADPPAGVTPHERKAYQSPRGLVLEGGIPVDGFRISAPDGTVDFHRAELEWRRLGPATPLPERSGSCFVFDERRSETLAFSGADRPADTWEFDGVDWIERTPQDRVSPPARRDHACAYHGRLGAPLLFGGRDGLATFSDLWRWDGAAWSVVAVDGVSPPARFDAAIAYDGRRSRLMVWGGRSESGERLADLWEWSEEEGWQAVSASPRPPPLDFPRAAYDEVRGRLVLVGVDEGGAARTWDWDGEAWRDRSAGPQPMRRAVADAGVVYDPNREVTVAVVCEDLQGTVRTWEWDDSGWTEAEPDLAPSCRAGSSATFDANLGALLFGAGSGSSDVWSWDGARWTQLLAGLESTPPARRDHTLFFDADRGQVVMAGGRSTRGSDDLFDTWALDGRTWRRIETATSAPEIFTGEIVVLPDGRILHFDGLPSGTEVREWSGRDWSLPLDTGTAFRFAKAALPYALDRDGDVILFGAVSLGVQTSSTWSWNDEGWTDVTDASTSALEAEARALHMAAFDAERRQLVLYGGRAFGEFLDEVWEWDGVRWQEVSPSGDTPGGRGLAPMLFHEGRGTTMFFGGGQCLDCPERARNDLWEWTGTAWRNLTPTESVRPSPRTRHAMAYDPLADRVILFGGIEENDTRDLRADTWELLRADRSAYQFVARVGARLGTVEDVDVVAYCGGIHGEGGANAGAELLVWDTGGEGRSPDRFTVVDDNTTAYTVADAEQTLGIMDPTASALRWRSPDPPSARRKVVGLRGEREVIVQCRVRGRGKPDPATVALDYAEVRVGARWGTVAP